MSLAIDIDFQSLKTTGIKVNYLYVCERKLWLFDRGIQMEYKSDKVLMGKLLGESSYSREDKKEVLIDNLINIDIVGDDGIGEVKYSNRLANADRIQLLYYLYYLKQLGIEKRGIINYPKMTKREEIMLNSDAEFYLNHVGYNSLLDNKKLPFLVSSFKTDICWHWHTLIWTPCNEIASLNKQHKSRIDLLKVRRSYYYNGLDA